MGKSSNAPAIVLVLFMLLCFFILLFVAEKSYEVQDAEIEYYRERFYDENERADSLQKELDELHELSIENVEYWIDTLDIKHPEVVMQQVKLETGWLSSDICNENNNLFGMKEPRIRETTALGTKRGHAYYENYIESIKDYKLWQVSQKGCEARNYYNFLASVGYAEAPNYIRTLKSI